MKYKMNYKMNHKTIWGQVCVWLLVLGILYLQHFQLEYSTCVGIRAILLLDIRWLFLNLIAISVFSVVLYILTGSIFAALAISGAVVTILSLVDYHVTLFHGAPFFASDFFSIPTAMNVMGEYSISFSSIVLRLIGITVIEMVLLAVLFLLTRSAKGKKKYRLHASILLIAELVILWITVISPWRIAKEPMIKWAWETSVNHYGYELCVMDSARLLVHTYNEPDGYSADLITFPNDTDSNENVDETYPDIILILNETHCDISHFSTVTEGRTVLDNMK